MNAHQSLIRSASWLVPANLRKGWLAEWTAELRYVECRCAPATRFCLGAFRDALWLRRHSPWNLWRLTTPSQCLSSLAIAATLFGLLTFVMPASRGFAAFYLQRGPLFVFLLMVAIALIILPTTTSFNLGDYPSKRTSRLFLAGKLALSLPVVFFGTLILGSLIARGLQPHGFMIGLVLAFRWAFVDQRRRCPECLRLLANPMRVGSSSRTFLEWYGTEFVCMRGHGLMHVPEIPTTSFKTQRWVRLDRSWSGLFS